MDDNCGEWVQCMGVTSGCGEQEMGVASGSGWNLWVWLLGVVVRRYIDFLILLIPTPLVSVSARRPCDNTSNPVNSSLPWLVGNMDRHCTHMQYCPSPEAWGNTYILVYLPILATALPFSACS